MFLGFGRSGKYPLLDIEIEFEHITDRIQIADARPLAQLLLQHALGRLAELGAEMARAPAHSGVGP